MRTIELDATITPGGLLTIEIPTDIPPGTHRVVIVIDDHEALTMYKPPFNFPVDDVGPWPENLSLRREDMYDDWGR